VGPLLRRDDADEADGSDEKTENYGETLHCGFAAA